MMLSELYTVNKWQSCVAVVHGAWGACCANHFLAGMKNGLGQIHYLTQQVHPSLSLMTVATVTSTNHITSVSVHCVSGDA